MYVSSERESGGVELQAGDIMVGPMGGVVPGFFPVGVGQAALFLTRRWWRMVKSVKAWWHYRHVAVVTNAGGWGPSHDGGERWICQAMPRGVEHVPLGQKSENPAYLFIRPDYRGAGVSGHLLAAAALYYLGTPYNFLTYCKLAAGAFRMRLTEGWLKRKISTRRDMMCSQHVDQALADAGYHVFDDGRLPQDVVPAELADALLSLPGWHRRGGETSWTPNRLAGKL